MTNTLQTTKGIKYGWLDLDATVVTSHQHDMSQSDGLCIGLTLPAPIGTPKFKDLQLLHRLLVDVVHYTEA